MEKVIVRTTIFGLAIYMFIVFYFAWNGILVTFDGYVVLLDYCLYRLACDEGRYHCKYARAIPINLMFTDTIACLDDTRQYHANCGNISVYRINYLDYQYCTYCLSWYSPFH